VRALFDFWGECLRDPRRVGSILPSGAPLGEAIAHEVLASEPGYVVEVGAGTGAITEELVAIRHRLDGLTVVEKSPKLAQMLSRRYAGVDIRTGCASRLAGLQLPADVPLTLVSSLPFRSLPRSEMEAIRQTIVGLGHRHRQFRLIQYSYFGRLPFACHVPSLAWARKKTILANLPPATIWVLGLRGH
jgi:phospholipid N-methyltransferase